MSRCWIAVLIVAAMTIITPLWAQPPLQVAPAGIGIENPAFDVTPAALVTAIITEQGVARWPFAAELAAMVAAAEA